MYDLIPLLLFQRVQIAAKVHEDVRDALSHLANRLGAGVCINVRIGLHVQTLMGVVVPHHAQQLRFPRRLRL